MRRWNSQRTESSHNIVSLIIFEYEFGRITCVMLGDMDASEVLQGDMAVSRSRSKEEDGGPAVAGSGRDHRRQCASERVRDPRGRHRKRGPHGVKGSLSSAGGRAPPTRTSLALWAPRTAVGAARPAPVIGARQRAPNL